MKSKSLGHHTFRLDDEKVIKLKKLGIDLPVLVRDLIDQTLHEKTCPACGQKVDPKNAK